MKYYLLGHDAIVMFNNVLFHNLSTSSNHPLFHLTHSKLSGDFLSFNSLNCTLFEFISTDVHLSNSSFEYISLSTIATFSDSSFNLSSSIFSNVCIYNIISMILLDNSYAYFNSVMFSYISSFSLIETIKSDVKLNRVTFSHLDSASPFYFTDSSSCLIEDTVISNSNNHVCFNSESSTLNLSTLRVHNVTTNSFLNSHESVIFSTLLEIVNTTILDVCVKLLQTSGLFQNIIVHSSQVFEFFQMVGSSFHLNSIDFGSTNSLTTSLFNVSFATVKLHDISIIGPFRNSVSLFKVHYSDVIVFGANVTHLTSSLISSDYSAVSFAEISIINSTADWLIFTVSSNSSFSNIWISNVSSVSNHATLRAALSSISLSNVIVDFFWTSSFISLSDSLGSIVNSTFNYVNSIGSSWIHLVGSHVQVENMSNSYINVMTLIKLDNSQFDSESLSLIRSQIDSVLVSNESRISLGQLDVSFTNISQSFTVLTNSLMNVNSLSFGHTSLLMIIEAYESTLDLDQLQLQGVFIYTPSVSCLFRLSNSTFVFQT
ncbi:hypothetical protein GEMRC1_013952 [Eukaryota sp. GEM-RC1]